MSLSVSCKSLEKYQVQIRTTTHSWIADEPVGVGGDGLGPSPFEVLLGSLGACIIVTLFAYASRRKMPLEGVGVQLDDRWTKEDGKERYHVVVTVRVRGDLGDADFKRVTNAATRCPVHKVLAPGIDIQTEVVLL